MMAALLLLTYAVIVGTFGDRVLRGEWTTRSPKPAILAWQALSTSVVLAVVLAASALALPFLPVRNALASALGAHTLTVVEHYETPLGAWPAAVALLAATSASSMLAVTTLRTFRRDALMRRSQRDALTLVGRPHPDGFTLVEHPLPVAYCLPGRSGTVVLSSAAMNLLTERERALVLGHENRHLRARHHLALAYADTLAKSFPRVALFSAAHDAIAVLVEMAADDAATSADDRRLLARALVALGTGVRPEATLAASDTAAVQRVRRLTAVPHAKRRGMSTLAVAASLAVLSAPVGLALAPAIEAATRDCCSLVPTTPRT